MFRWYLYQQIFDTIQELMQREEDDSETLPQQQDVGRDASIDIGPLSPPEAGTDTESDSALTSSFKLTYQLPYDDCWFGGHREWESTFISSKARLTKTELLCILCTKLGLSSERSNHRLLAEKLQWQFYGSLCTKFSSVSRKFVGMCRKSPRRDFIRVQGPPDNNTCLSVQLLMFVKISGFGVDHGDLVLPEIYRNPLTNTGSVIFALVRWLSPHPDALLRDSQLRPICRAPLDINHALWTFTTAPRPLLSQSIVNKNFKLYGGDEDTRKRNSRLEKGAMFDLLQPECFETYMNCTPVDEGTDDDNVNLLETITIPF